jgi:hypothetical protein
MSAIGSVIEVEPKNPPKKTNLNEVEVVSSTHLTPLKENNEKKAYADVIKTFKKNAEVLPEYQRGTFRSISGNTGTPRSKAHRWFTEGY